MRKLSFLFFFCLLFVSAQELEKDIYTALDDFLESPSEIALQQLSQKEKSFEKKVGSKEEQLALVVLQCNRAYYLKEKEKFPLAIESYEKAWMRYDKEKLSRYDIIEYCLKPLGNLYIKTNNYTSAEGIIKLYTSKAEKENNLSHKIAGITNLCLLFQTINKHEEVINIVNQTLQLYNVPQDQKERLQSIKNDSSLKKGDYVKSVNSNYLLYREQLFTKKYNEAFNFFKKAQKEQFDTSLNIRMKTKWLLEEVQLLLLLNKTDEATNKLNVALNLLLPEYKEGEEFNGLYPESLLIDVFDLKAELENDIKLSLKYYDKSFYVESLLRNLTTTQQTQLLYQSNTRNRSEKCIELALQYYFETQSEEMLNKALYYADKGKSYLINTKKKISKLRLENPNDSFLIKEKVLQTEKENIVRKIQNNTRHSDSIFKYRSQFARIDQELRRINQKLINKFSILQGNSINIKEVKEKAAKLNTAFVIYFYGRRKIHQFIINASKIWVNQIELTSELKEDIVAYLRLFDSSSTINNNVNNYTNLAFKLYKRLKFDELSAYQNIGLIPDGILNFIPFETLLTRESKTVFFNKMPFLVKRQNIIYNFNLQMFLESKKINQNLKVAGFFPVFKNTTKELAFSEKEAEVIKKNFETSLYLNEKANEVNFIKELNQKEIIHISTHSENKGVSSEAFIDFFNRKMSLNELYSFECNADLVVLSACETGVGSLIKGEGAMSLARGFSYIGAENLLFTLWKVNDKSSSEIIKNFYLSLKDKNVIDKANYQSKLNYINNPKIENAYKSPYYWGAFVYYGSIENQENSNKLLFLILGFIVLFIIFLQLRK